MNLVQFRDAGGARRVGVVDGTSLRILAGWTSTYELARTAIARRSTLAALVAADGGRGTAVLAELLAAKAVLPPLDHPDPAHCFITGTGLTHLGSAHARNAMHEPVAAEASLTDSMRLFRQGVQGGKPADGAVPVQPEWFYKGDGSFLVPPEHPLERPAFADDGGEEPELVGLYLIAEDGTPCRLGFALGNEFSDHVMERKNYLYLAHSKLRECSVGPELHVGELPAAIEGNVRLWRGNRVLWEAPFQSGEANMSYNFAGLEHHHFKYRQFCRPGDVHLHFFGTSTLSIAAGVHAAGGDTFEVSAPPFTVPLRNPMRVAGDTPRVTRVL